VAKDTNSNKEKDMEFKESQSLFQKALQYFPGGVNSPVRAFKSVGGTPLFIQKGNGCRIWDEDDNEYIDFCGSWGPLILGHNHPAVNKAIVDAVNLGTSFGTPTRKENELAELILANHRYIEKIRFVSSGTEAAMSVLRLARGYTGRNKIIKFEGCYHGHVDSLLVKAGSGLVTLGTSSSAGIPPAYAAETIVLPLNDKQAVEEAVKTYKNDIAAIAIEPIPANNGLLIQGEDFLKFLREICTREGILLFFDEVISGFRVGFEGASGFYGIQPDVIAFGKIIGGGMPVGAYGASREVMSKVAPDGPVYQAGTLSGNPVAMAAGAAQLRECLKPGFYENLEKNTSGFVQRINRFAKQKGYPFEMTHIASIFWMSFNGKANIHRADEIDGNTMTYFAKFFHHLLEHGVYIGPSGYEVGFMNAAHGERDIEEAENAFMQCLDKVFKKD
jgi:glutamate-1-semialdehyde 2,1-aminomutase